ncbi:MAG: hypothetical protein IMZ55_06495, partial [Acidobacteria bacterium]|nr:hypothetical protein [Acidobacteriota bacterium]
IDVWDINGFVSKYTAGNLDADMRGQGFTGFEPDGVVDVWDINGFVSRYNAATTAGTHLDPLPTAGPLVAGNPAPLTPTTEPSDEADLLAIASGTLVRPLGVGDEPGAATAIPIAAAVVVVPEAEALVLNRIEPAAGAWPDADRFAWEEGTSPDGSAAVPHDLADDLVDVLELVGLGVPLGV